jgi:hypothetical protein
MGILIWLEASDSRSGGKLSSPSWKFVCALQNLPALPLTNAKLLQMSWALTTPSSALGIQQPSFSLWISS